MSHKAENGDCPPSPMGRVSLAKGMLISLFFIGALILSPPPTWAASCPPQPHAHTPGTAKPLNLGELKLQLIDYKCFGAYEREVASVLVEAKTYIERRTPEVARPAMILDIDETAISNWQAIIANDFGYFVDGACDLLPRGPCGARAWELSAHAEVIAPTLALFNAAKEKGVAIFFITGRKGDEVNRAATETNLRAAGYAGWTGLIMRPAGGHSGSAKDYKTVERAKIAGQGFSILANVGDQQSDLDGGYAERTFLVPNPFYFIR